jgi:hypothetical protein
VEDGGGGIDAGSFGVEGLSGGQLPGALDSGSGLAEGQFDGPQAEGNFWSGLGVYILLLLEKIVRLMDCD